MYKILIEIGKDDKIIYKRQTVMRNMRFELNIASSVDTSIEIFSKT